MSKPTTNPILLVQGAQWGSEAKGAVAAALGIERKVDYMIRTGTVNAGHTVLYKGKTYKMQQLPVGWTRPETKLIVGPGAFIHPEILEREILMVNEATGFDVRDRLFVDYRCGLHLPIHTERSTAAGRHFTMGATGKGCSEAVIDKIRKRGHEGMLFMDWLNSVSRLAVDGLAVPQPNLDAIHYVDTVEMINRAWDEGAKLLIEGTQGTLLDLHTGPYPYTTHKSTLCGNWIAEAGLSPNLPYEIVLVARTFPIRVAGNSGPMPDEISWMDLALEINKRLISLGREPRVNPKSLQAFAEARFEIARNWTGLEGDALATPCPRSEHIEYWTPKERAENPFYVSDLHALVLEQLSPEVRRDLQRLFEMTTVTGKLRRIARLNIGLLRESIRLNRPNYMVMTFVNYHFPEIWDQTQGFPDATNTELIRFVQRIEMMSGAPIHYITTGAATECVLPYAR